LEEAIVTYKLKNHWNLDSGSDVHICNKIELVKVALIQGYMMNLLTLPLLNEGGIHWNTRSPWQLERSNEKHFCNLKQVIWLFIGALVGAVVGAVEMNAEGRNGKLRRKKTDCTDKYANTQYLAPSMPHLR
jgi:hypothetical protein